MNESSMQGVFFISSYFPHSDISANSFPHPQVLQCYSEADNVATVLRTRTWSREEQYNDAI